MQVLNEEVVRRKREQEESRVAEQRKKSLVRFGLSLMDLGFTWTRRNLPF